MLRVISHNGCHGFPDRKLLYTQSSLTREICGASGKCLIRRTGGFWNRYIYEFPGDDPYQTRPSEPPLTWHLGIPFFSRERIESDGFSGPLIRQRAADQLFFYLGETEWRVDLSQSELYYEVKQPKAELRTTLLAFSFYLGSQSG